MVTHRSPILILLLTFMSLGIYFFFWLYSTKKEMEELGADIPPFWVFFLPIVGLYWLYKYCLGAAEITKKKSIWGLGCFILLLIFFPAGMVLIQTGLNKPYMESIEAMDVETILERSGLDKAGRYQDSIEYYNEALEIDPEDSDAWSNKGAMLDNVGKHQEALACYDKALETNPRDSMAWYNKGNALSNLGKHQEALACYDKALEIKPRDFMAWYNKGNSLGNLCKYEEAIECYDKALEIDPGDKGAKHYREICLKHVSE